MCILGNRNTGTLTHCEAHPRCYTGSGADNNETQEEGEDRNQSSKKTERDPTGNQMQGMKAHRR